VLRHDVEASCVCSPEKAENLASNRRSRLGSRPIIRLQPSIASSVMPVSLFKAVLAFPLLVSASRANKSGVDVYALNSASSFLSLKSASASSGPGVAESTVPPTSSTSYVSSRSSSSESKAARAERIADLLGAAPRSERMVSAVELAFLRPMWRREVSTARRSNSSLSKTLRRSLAGGVGRGVKRGIVAEGEGLVC
jgi:hypothetical protein